MGTRIISHANLSNGWLQKHFQQMSDLLRCKRNILKLQYYSECWGRSSMLHVDHTSQKMTFLKKNIYRWFFLKLLLHDFQFLDARGGERQLCSYPPPPLPPAREVCIPLHVPVTNHHTDLAKNRVAQHRKYHIQAFSSFTSVCFLSSFPMPQTKRCQLLSALVVGN